MVQEMHHKPTWNVHEINILSKLTWNIHEINLLLNLLEMYIITFTLKLAWNVHEINLHLRFDWDLHFIEVCHVNQSRL
jgi:hypothetical protein